MMAREFKKKKPFKKSNVKGKRKGPNSSQSEEGSFHKRTFGKTTEKKGFDPNEDLSHGKESYSVRKRKNLLEEDKKAPFEKSFRSNDKKTFGKKTSGKSYKKTGEGESGFSRRKDDERGEHSGRFNKKSADQKPFSKKPFGGSFKESHESEELGSRESSGFKRRADDRGEQSGRFSKKPYSKVGRATDKKPFEKPYRKFKQDNEQGTNDKPYVRDSGGEDNKPFKRKFVKKSLGPGYKKLTQQDEISASDGLIRLNKYIANAGICSRREADELILAGAVSVNGKVVTEMGYKVKPDDLINYGGETLRKEKLVYVLLNKPKDFITTLDDPADRKTVFDLVRNACKERIYPVGRLDRNTTGVLLLTNDGDLTKKLTHPKHGIKKIYMVTLDKPLNKPDFDEIANNGVTLEDGHIKPDAISYVGEGSGKKEVGVEIHSGRNRVVRRLFEQFGYTVVKLDRVVFAGLTKKDLPRGNWRLLTEKEVGYLKMMG